MSSFSEAMLLFALTATPSFPTTSTLHTCPSCGAEFASRNQLYSHLRLVEACGAASGLDLESKRPSKLRKSLLLVGYHSATGGRAASSLLQEHIESCEGAPVHAMTRASDWHYRRSPLLERWRR